MTAKMKRFDLLVTVALVLCSLTFYYKQPQHYDIAYTSFIFGLAILNFNNINIRHICGLIIAFKLIIYSLMNFYILEKTSVLSGFYQGIIIFGIQLFALVILASILFFRPVLSRWIHSKLSLKSNTEISITFADNLLFAVFCMLALITLLAFGENLIRNLEYMGVSEDFAKHFWEWTFFFTYYEIFIHILELLVCLIVLCQTLVNPRVLEDKLVSE